MELSLWLLFIFTFASVLAIPGPNAIYAIAQTVSHGPRSGLVASAGFAFASGLNILIVMFGLGVVLAQNMGILIYLKWVGVAYLIYMGIKTFRSPPSAAQSRGEVRDGKVFLFAVLVSLSNPKVVLFNLAILPLFLVPDRSILIQGAVITLTGTALSFVVYSIYALVASRFIAKLQTRTANRVIGSGYLAAAGALASIQR